MESALRMWFKHILKYANLRGLLMTQKSDDLSIQIDKCDFTAADG